jgi:hypothetical protein
MPWLDFGGWILEGGFRGWILAGGLQAGGLEAATVDRSSIYHICGIRFFVWHSQKVYFKTSSIFRRTYGFYIYFG